MSTMNLQDPDFFTRNIPVWTEILSTLKNKPNIEFIEVGSLYGKSACWLLTNILTHPTSRLTCVDLFSRSPESLAYCKILGLEEFGGNFPANALFDFELDTRIAAIGATDRVTKMIGDSEVMLRKLPLDFYDGAYIDGSHTSRNVLTDLVLCWGMLKIGGILIMDDYTLSTFSDNQLKNPIIGIKAFLTVFKDEYEVLHESEQMIIRKTAHKDDIWKFDDVSALA